MIKSITHALPLVVFIILSSATCALLYEPSQWAILVGGGATALTIGLLFYAAVHWDEAHQVQAREKRELAEVVDYAIDPIVITDGVGHVLYANAAARSGFELPEALDAATLYHMGLPESQVGDILDGVVAGNAWDGEINRRDASGRMRSFLIKMFRMAAFQGHSRAVVCMGRDTTERKQLEHELRHSHKLAAVGELAAGVAHEINNPMAAIQSQVGLARDLIGLDASGDPEKLLGCLDHATAAVQRCTRIVDSLLRFSHRDAEDLGPTAVGPAIDQAVTFVQALPKASRLTFDLRVPSGLPAVHSNSESIAQVLINLLINAADACGPEGNVRIAAFRDGDGVGIEVRDDGRGIPQQDIERVFEPFFTTKPVGQGTGLGLSISYGIARSIGATLSLEAPRGGGTRATLTVPINPAVQPGLPMPAGAAS